MNDEVINLTTVTDEDLALVERELGRSPQPRSTQGPRREAGLREDGRGKDAGRQEIRSVRHLRGGRLHRKGLQRAPDRRQQVRRALRGPGHSQGRRQDPLQALQLRHARGRLPRRRRLPEVHRLHEEDADPGPPARGLRRPGPVRRDHGQGRRPPPDRAADDRAGPPGAREEPPPPRWPRTPTSSPGTTSGSSSAKRVEILPEKVEEIEADFTALRPLGRDRGPGPEVLRPRGLVGPLRPDLPEPERPAREEVQEGLHPAGRLGLGQVAPQDRSSTPCPRTWPWPRRWPTSPSSKSSTSPR